MVNTSYLASELLYRRQRSLVTLLLVAAALAIMLLVSALAGALQKAFQAPLADMGAALIVQKSGDVPEKMAGPVLPCSLVPIKEEQVGRIAGLAGVQGVSEVVLFWDFQDELFQIVSGFRPGDQAGPALLAKALIKGRFLRAGEQGKALADQSWAQSQGLALGQTHIIGGQPFELVGLVDSSRLSQIAAGQLYINLADARLLVSQAPGVQEVEAFAPEDVNLLFLQADRQSTEQISVAIKEIIGKKAAVASPQSFQQTLGSLFTLTSRFSVAVSLLTALVALLLVARSTVAAIKERAAEVGALKAVGWQSRQIMVQLGAESSLLVGCGALLGIGLGLLAAWLLSGQTIAIPIPWDMAPTPHFLPGGDVQLSREVALTLPPLLPLVFSALGSALLINLVTLFVIGRALARLKPSEVLRYE